MINEKDKLDRVEIIHKNRSLKYFFVCRILLSNNIIIQAEFCSYFDEKINCYFSLK